MRNASADELALLAQTDRANHIRIYIDRGAADWVNLCDVEGRDWIDSAEWGEGVDNAVSEATIRIKRSEYLLSMVPLMTSSKLNATATLLDLGHPIYIETAITQRDGAPHTTDWQEVFRGEVEQIDWGSNIITMRCLDQGGDLQAAWIESKQKYPVDPATQDDVEDIIQAILDDWGNSVVLYSETGDAGTPFKAADTPGWMILEYFQDKAPVMQAILRLVGMIGWDLRYRWNDNVTAFVLTMMEPDRAKAVADHTFDSCDYYDITNMSLDRTMIRNVVKITYLSSGVPTTVTRTDAASVAKYGRRYMEIAEAASSQIDSAAEANTMGDAILNDLCEPTADKTVNMPYFWPAMLGDLYAFTANDVHYDSTQTLAVVSFKHSYANGKFSTQLMCRGKPSARGMRWLEYEARGGIANPSDTFSDEKATGVTITPAINGIIVTYDNPVAMSPPIFDWAYTACYVSTTNGVKGSEYARGRTTRFEIYGLIPDISYYVTLDIIDYSGNVATSSTQATGVTVSVGPYHCNQDTDKVNIIPNGEFGIRSPPKTRADDPPDRWVTCDTGVETDTWGASDEVYDSETTHLTGYRSIFIDPSKGTSAFPGIMSEFYPIQEGELYRLLVVTRGTNAATEYGVAAIYYEGDKSTGAGAALVGGTFAIVGANVWLRAMDFAAAPANARFVRVCAGQDAGAAGTLFFDSIYFFKALPSFRAMLDGHKTYVLGALVHYDDEIFDYDNYYSAHPVVGTYKFTAPHEGLYGFYAGALADSVDNGSFAYLVLFKNAAIAVDVGQTFYNSTGVAKSAMLTVVSKGIDLAVGDTIEVRVYHNNVGGTIQLNDIDYSVFSGWEEEGAGGL